MALKPRKQRKSYINITIKDGLIKALKNHFMIYSDGELWFYKNIKSARCTGNYIPFYSEFNHAEGELLDLKIKEWIKDNIHKGLIKKVKINVHYYFNFTDYDTGEVKRYENYVYNAYVLSLKTS